VSTTNAPDSAARHPTATIDERLKFKGPGTKNFISEHIRALIRQYHIPGIKSERAWDLFYDIIFLDPVTTRHFAQFQGMWKYRNAKDSPHYEWWRAFHTYMSHRFDKTHEQMNNWRRYNPEAFGDPIVELPTERTRSGKWKPTGKQIKWYGTADLMAKLEPPSCRGGKAPASFLALQPVKCLMKGTGTREDDQEWSIRDSSPAHRARSLTPMQVDR